MELSDKDQRALEMLEETLWRAQTRYDVGLMEQTFAADFIEIGRSGRCFERAELLVEPDQNAIIDARFPLAGYCVGLITPGVALATYTSEVRYGGDLQRARRSSLWIKLEGRWQLRFHQGTAC